MPTRIFVTHHLCWSAPIYFHCNAHIYLFHLHDDYFRQQYVFLHIIYTCACTYFVQCPCLLLWTYLYVFAFVLQYIMMFTHANYYYFLFDAHAHYCTCTHMCIHFCHLRSTDYIAYTLYTLLILFNDSAYCCLSIFIMLTNTYTKQKQNPWLGYKRHQLPSRQTSTWPL